jgi:hypothetical protein
MSIDESRIATVWIAVLAPLLISAAGYIWNVGETYGAVVKGRPASRVFGIVWTSLTVLWMFAGYQANLHFDDVSLQTFMIFVLSSIGCGVYWLYVYSLGNKAEAAQVLLVNLLFGALSVVSACTSSLLEGSDDNKRMIVALAVTPHMVWIIGAALFNYLEINKN